MKIIIANLKMNLLLKDVINYKKQLENIVTSNEVVVCPSSLFIPYLISNKYSLGSQNIFYENKGSFTGEISAEQLKSLNVKYTIVGHSERKKYFNETNKIINKKIKVLLDNNIIPIICVGEKKQTKSNKKYKAVNNQIKECLKSIKNINDIIIAYEPIWSIGTGLIPEYKEIENMIANIKKEIKKNNNYDVKVIYGGSINEENIVELNKIENNNGFLIGSSSMDVNEFINIINKIN